MKKISDISSSKFASHIRERGYGYYIRDRISIISINDFRVTAIAHGTRTYNLYIFFKGKGQVDHWGCSCPYASDGTPCKHLWALLLTLDDIDAESGYPDSESGSREDFDSEFDEGDLGVDASWQARFRMLQSAVTGYTAKLPEPLPADGYTRIVYCLPPEDLDLESEDFHIRTMLCKRRINGGWGKPRPLSLSSHQFERFQTESDRLAKVLILGSCMINDYQFGCLASDSTYDVVEDMVDQVLDTLFTTGHLFINGLDGYLDGIPLQDHRGECWELMLNLQQSGEQYMVEAVFVCGNRKMDISEPKAVYSNGMLVYENSLACYDKRVSFAWIEMLRKMPRMVIQQDKIESWIEEYAKTPCSPELNLPEELDYSTVTKNPVPVLRLKDYRYYGGRGLLARLYFRYGTHEIPEEYAGDYVPGEHGREIVRRDFSAEEQAVAMLDDWCFTVIRGCFAASSGILRSLPDSDDTLLELKRAGWDIYLMQQSLKSCSLNVSVTHNIDWFDVRIESDFGGEVLAIPQILKSIAKGSRFVRLSDGSFGMLSEDDLSQIKLLARLGERQGDEMRFKMSQVFLLDALLSQCRRVDWDARSSQILQLLSGVNPDPQDPADCFQGSLRDYQRDGLGWLLYLQKLNLGGCLADDMGLGKTVQALALLQKRKCSAGSLKTSLVVVPKSLIFNWCSEASRFTPDLKVITHHGTGRTRDAAQFENADIVVTTYGTARQDAVWLKEYNFDYIILDEAQTIKNANTATAKAVRLLSANHRLTMSGTPIENHLGELWSMFEFLNPGMLGEGSWLRQKKSRDDLTDEARELIAKAVRPFILRRTKEQVASELPPKTEETIYCEMPPKQKAAYNELRKYYQAAIKGKVNEDGLAKSKIMVLEALLRLRQAACHPALIKPDFPSSQSGKLEALRELINDIIPAGHKVLVFSQFTSLLAIVKTTLEKAHIAYAYLDGKTRDREACVKNFQNNADVPVFLISLKAGGLGLNLTAADYVILLDPWWNPAVEAQAIDRAYRIGQTRHVFAYRIVTKDTVEEKILELQKSKRALADSIINKDNSLVASLTEAELNILLS